jgi:O-acetylhomoserine/O-acetylserine sulfhydrylase-like pyridoxal-dependent enzyme
MEDPRPTPHLTVDTLQIHAGATRHRRAQRRLQTTAYVFRDADPPPRCSTEVGYIYSLTNPTVAVLQNASP